MMRTIRTLTIVASLGLGASHADEESAPVKRAKELLATGLFAEEAEKKLEEASANYLKIIEDFDKQREFAVAALYRLAEVRRKQKRKDDAVQIYQRIVARFPDAEPQARLSRENLAAMGIAVTGPTVVPDDPEETKQLRRLMMLAENSPEQVWKGGPLSLAARKGWMRVTTWVLEYAKKTEQEELHLPLYVAALAGHLEICKILLAEGADITTASKCLRENSPFLDGALPPGEIVEPRCSRGRSKSAILSRFWPGEIL